jgi:hypothetical protein
MLRSKQLLLFLLSVCMLEAQHFWTLRTVHRINMICAAMDSPAIKILGVFAVHFLNNRCIHATELWTVCINTAAAINFLKMNAPTIFTDQGMVERQLFGIEVFFEKRTLVWSKIATSTALHNTLPGFQNSYPPRVYTFTGTPRAAHSQSHPASSRAFGQRWLKARVERLTQPWLIGWPKPLCHQAP